MLGDSSPKKHGQTSFRARKSMVSRPSLNARQTINGLDQELGPKVTTMSPRKSHRSTGRNHHEATVTTTLNSAYGDLKNKKGEKDDVCRYVKLEMFKAIYGHGLNVKFVKLLFLLLKKQVPRFIEHMNSQAKAVIAAQKLAA